MISPKIAVSSLSFSKNRTLRSELMSHYSTCVFNETNGLLQGDDLVQFIKDADAVIAGTETFSEEVLCHCSKLRVISKYGVGLDNIDFDASKQRGIDVYSKQGVNKLSVAEMTLGFMLSLSRNLYKTSVLLKQGDWVKDGGVQLSGKTIGIIGLGHIGKEVVRLLQPFGCRVLVNDIIDQTEYCRKNGLIYSDLESLVSQSDLITIHTDLNDTSRYLVNMAMFKKMKSSAFFINTARGELVVQSDLKQALLTQEIAGAAIDVFEIEPVNDPELTSLPTLYCTPHIGANAKEAVLLMGMAAIENLVLYFEKE